ncbi:hypothetical protein M758_1G217300 [Ceratodon purpureus]|nr:hypothetical protein M758_1G217300 [Ceratodon purpureus]
MWTTRLENLRLGSSLALICLRLPILSLSGVALSSGPVQIKRVRLICHTWGKQLLTPFGSPRSTFQFCQIV